MAKTLYLHVGHGKTGSSYIQSILSTHRQRILGKLGINYPVVESDRSSEGKISSGNGAIFLRDPGNPEHVDCGSGDGSVLYSSEFLFAVQKNWLNRQVIDQLLTKFDCINVLIFIRNPDEMLSSAYQQSVKRGGYTDTIEKYSETFNFFRDVEIFLKKLDQLPGIHPTVYNYSFGRSRVASLLSKWLGSNEVLDVSFPPINRSLTYAEIALQREINVFFGKSGDLVADELCERLPELRSDVIRPNRDAWLAFRAKNLPTIQEINNLVPLAERLAFEEELDRAKPMQATLDVAQIQVIAQSLFGKLVRKA